MSAIASVDRAVVDEAVVAKTAIVPWADSKVRELDISLQGQDRISVTFDPSVFQENTSGEVTVRFTTSKARLFMDQIERRRRDA